MIYQNSTNTNVTVNEQSSNAIWTNKDYAKEARINNELTGNMGIEEYFT